MERTGIILKYNIPACGRQEFVVADDAKQAELKSGLVADLPARSPALRDVGRSGLGFRLCHDV
jgi:hypothetical protein